MIRTDAYINTGSHANVRYVCDMTTRSHEWCLVWFCCMLLVTPSRNNAQHKIFQSDLKWWWCDCCCISKLSNPEFALLSKLILVEALKQIYVMRWNILVYTLHSSYLGRFPRSHNLYVEMRTRDAQTSPCQSSQYSYFIYCTHNKIIGILVRHNIREKWYKIRSKSAKHVWMALNWVVDRSTTPYTC